MDRNPVRYHIDITVTHENLDEYGESSLDPDPGTLQGGISVRFNRKALDDWIMISLDVSHLIRTHFPSNYDPRISGVLLDSAERGVVYYDDISVTTTVANSFLQLLVFLYYNRIGQVILGALISIGLSELIKWGVKSVREAPEDMKSVP